MSVLFFFFFCYPYHVELLTSPSFLLAPLVNFQLRFSSTLLISLHSQIKWHEEWLISFPPLCIFHLQTQRRHIERQKKKKNGGGRIKPSVPGGLDDPSNGVKSKGQRGGCLKATWHIRMWVDPSLIANVLHFTSFILWIVSCKIHFNLRTWGISFTAFTYSYIGNK